MRKRESAEERNIEAARRLRKLQGARYGDKMRTFVELPVSDRQFFVTDNPRPENMRVSEFTLEDSLDVRILEAEGLRTIGSGRFVQGESKDRLEMLPISYDGDGMFWWLKASPVADVATAIKDEALSFVDRAIARRTWSDEEDAQVEARSVLGSVGRRYAVLPDNTILTGSAAPGLHFVDTGEWLTFRVYDKLSEKVETNIEFDLAARNQVPLVFGILEYEAADEFLALVAERNPDRRVVKEALVERRNTEWTKDFTHIRDRWADAGFFNDFVSGLNYHIGAMRPVGNKPLDAAFKALEYNTKMWLHDHAATNAKLDEFLSLRDMLLDIEPTFDDLLAERLKWSHKVKPLEVLEIRARGLKALISEPALSPSP
jgi:hypothetical protein